MKANGTARKNGLFGKSERSAGAHFAVVALVVCGSAGAFSPDAPANELEKRFWSEAPPAWQRLRELCQGIRANGTIVEEKNPGGKESTQVTSTFEYNAKDGNLRFLTKYTQGSRAGKGQIASINPDYSFVIEDGGSRGAGEVTYVGPSSKTILRNQKLLNCMFSPLRMLYTNVDDLVSSAGFKVSGVTQESGGVKVDFSSKHEPMENFLVNSGWMILDPKRSWALREFRVNANKGAVTIHSVIDYDGEIRGYPTAKHRSVELIDPSTKQTLLTYNYTYSAIDPGDVEASDCRLTSFGFPEPGFAKSRWMIWKVLAINVVVIGGVFFLSVYFRKRALRDIQVPQGSPPAMGRET